MTISSLPRIQVLFMSLATLVVSALHSQKPTSFEDRLKGFDQRTQLLQNSLLKGLEATSIGPTVFSCRVTDVEANPANPAEMYVAYASGGLWYSSNFGASFTPVFDQEASMTIGDIAVDWAKGVVWVGTGENNSSRSSYAGTGLYRSQDKGKTWEWRGLPESHHIGRIVLHPTNPNIVWVAVLGHLYSKNPERGVYRSADGGQTWQRTLFVNELSGAIDLVVDPSAPNTVYAATWQRERSAWNFSGAGEGSGIWKSTDAGVTFTKVSQEGAGFPTGPKVGRIGLAAGLKDGKTVLYASVDNQNPLPPKTPKLEPDELTKDQLRTMSAADFAKLTDAAISGFLKNNRFPEKYTTDYIKTQVSSGKITPPTLVEYLEDANSNLFETDFTGAEVYRSDDGGATWKKTHVDPIEQMNFTYGYYFSNIRCSANNADEVYLLGFLIIRSEDGGKSWKNINGDNVHVDHHALWLHPTKPGLLLNGNDGGLNISWDNGANWTLCNNPPVGQFYAIATDETEPYRVYGGAQDNGVWYGPSDYKASTEWHQTGKYPYQSLMGGDGMQIAVDTRDNNTVYTGYQFGNYFRINLRTGQTKRITPQHELGERPLRFNWQTPIHLSSHQQDVLYLGAHKLYRSFDKGEKWEAISGDLTNGGKPGNVPFGTLSALHESPLKFGLLYTGSDDGVVQVSKDGGDTWTRITTGLPEGKWVSRIQASAHEKGRVYLSLNGYRTDDFTAYLYVSENYGKEWRRIGLDLPAEPVNVVREDPINPELLYVGTDHGVYVSLDRGARFTALSNGFPAVPVHDLAIQKTAGDLVIGTHGRSMYKVPIKQLQGITPEVAASPVHLFSISKKRYSGSWGKNSAWKAGVDPELPVYFWMSNPGKATWKVRLKDGPEVFNGIVDGGAGLNQLKYNLEIKQEVVKSYAKKWNEQQKEPKKELELEKADTGKYYLLKGTYQFLLEKDGKTTQQTFTIE